MHRGVMGPAWRAYFSVKVEEPLGLIQNPDTTVPLGPVGPQSRHSKFCVN